MVHPVDRSPGRRFRAVTLIEAVLYVSIALALIVGGLVFFLQASTAARTSTLVRQLSAVVAETKILYKSQPLAVTADPTFGTSITSGLIAAGAVPADMVAGPATLTNPFGGTTDVQLMDFIGNALITLRLTGIPQSVCARILTSSSGSTMLTTGNTPISDGYMFGGANQGHFGFVNYIMNASEAGVQCKYGVAAHQAVGETGTPAGPGYSGNVDVFMGFLMDY